MLGKSKNIDDLKSSANTSPDPYLTKEEIASRYMFGRVYEDDGNGHTFSIDDDKTLNIFSNAAFF